MAQVQRIGGSRAAWFSLAMQLGDWRRMTGRFEIWSKRLRILALVGLTPLCLLGRGYADEPIPTEWETCYVMLITAAAGSGVALTREQAGEVMSRHAQYQLQLRAAGISVAAGGVGDGRQASLRGITVLRVADLSQAQRVAAEDPAVAAGVFEADVREWYIPAPGICALSDGDE